MNTVLFFLFAQPASALFGLLPQEGSGLSWGWILLILLILALVLLWWLLGPGAKRRRRRMADLPKPGQTTSAQAPKPSAPAGLPISPAAASPAAAPPAATTPTAETPTPAAAVKESAVEESAVEPPAPAEALPEISDSDDEAAAEAAGDTSTSDSAEEEGVDANVTETDVADADVPVAGGEAEEEEVAAPVEPENLRKIEGIGPKVAGVLSANGIVTFAQLAEAPVERLMEILEAEGLKFMKPDTWPEQAAFAAQGDWDCLQVLQDQLKGGRRIEE